MGLVTDSLVANWESSSYSLGTSWTDSISSKVITLSSSSSMSSDGIEFTSSITFSSASLSSLSLSYPMSFEWIGRIDSSSFSNSSPAHIFGLSSSNGSWSGICCYSKSSSNGIQLDIGSSATLTSGIYTEGNHHILLTINSSGIVTLYVDSATAKASQSSSNSYGTVSKTYLYNTEGSGRFVGAISAMRIWNKELSSDEITTLFTEETDPEAPVTVSLSTSYGTYYGSISNLTDGNTSTYWWTNGAQSASQYVKFSFSKPVIFNGLTAQTLNNTGDCISSGTVLQTSSDGNTWNTVGNFSGSATCTFSNLNITNISYVRIYVETASSNWLCVNEITLDYIEENQTDSTLKIKQNGSWVNVTTVYKKVDGSWVEKTDLSTLFDSNVNYVKA